MTSTKTPSPLRRQNQMAKIRRERDERSRQKENLRWPESSDVHLLLDDDEKVAGGHRIRKPVRYE